MRQDFRGPAPSPVSYGTLGAGWGGGHSLQHIAVELLLAVAQELPDHLPAEALALEQEVGHSNGGVRDEASRDQELDAFVWVSRGGRQGGEKE